MGYALKITTIKMVLYSTIKCIRMHAFMHFCMHFNNPLITLKTTPLHALTASVENDTPQGATDLSGQNACMHMHACACICMHMHV